MLWATLDYLDINTCHLVLAVCPDSLALQAIMIYEDAPLIYFRNYGKVRDVLVSAGMDLPPASAQRSEIYSRRSCAPPPPRKAKATMNCRAPVVCLVTVLPEV